MRNFDYQNEHLNNYLIDVLEYSEEDLKGLELYEKYDLIDDKEKFRNYNLLSPENKEIKLIKKKLKYLLKLNERFFNGFEKTTIKNFIDLINIEDFKEYNEKI